MDHIQQFKEERKDRIDSYANDKKLKESSSVWLKETFKKKFEYNFEWMGRPIIQYPTDIIAIQELIWKVKPDLIIEIGIAHGGSIIFSASMLELLKSDGEVLGVDIDIRDHNRKEIEDHPMFKRITLIEGDSTSKEIANKIADFAKMKNKKNIMLFLDSNHTHDHVLKELNLYSGLIAKNSYIVVFDTFVEDLPDELSENRPWGKGNNPKTAVWEFLKQNNSFEIDKEIENKLLVTSAPDGFLKKL